MKRYLSGFISGATLTLLICSLTIGVSAISSRMTIEVDPINVQVNGEIFQPKDAKGNEVPVFVYNGTTYAPLRALAEAYGLEVGYDAESNMATVQTKEAAPAVQPTATPDTTAKLDYSDWSEEEKAIYKELVEDWEYTYDVLDESKSPDKSMYTGNPKSGKTEITGEAIKQCEHCKELIHRVASEIDTWNKEEVVINYPFGHFATVGSELAGFVE